MGNAGLVKWPFNLSPSFFLSLSLSSFYRDILDDEILDQKCLWLRRGAESWGKRRGDRVSVERSKRLVGHDLLFLSLKWEAPFTRPDQKGKGLETNRLAEAPLSSLVWTPLSNPRKGSAARQGALTAKDKARPYCPAVHGPLKGLHVVIRRESGMQATPGVSGVPGLPVKGSAGTGQWTL